MKIKTYNGQPVRTINAKDVDYLELELLDDTERIQTLRHQLESTTKNQNTSPQQIQQMNLEINRLCMNCIDIVISVSLHWFR